MSALVANALSKSYGDLKAVDGVDLSIEEGAFFGLLGPNGAGKTTLISMLSTMLKPTSGHATVGGVDILEDPAAVRRQIGVVFQDPSLDEELTAEQNLRFHAKLYKMPRSLRESRIDELLKIVELDDRRKDVVKTYSGGMRRRLELARGLLHRPRLLFLDEPTLGLDPQTRSHLWDYIRKLNEEDRITMLLTTHYMEEADALCDRVAIMDHGRLVVQDTPAELKDAIGGDVLYLSLNGKTQDLIPVLERVPNVRAVRATNEGVQIETAQAESMIPPILDAARAAGASVQSISLKKPTLNDVFLKHTGHAIRDEAMDSKDRMSYYMRGHRRH